MAETLSEGGLALLVEAGLVSGVSSASSFSPEALARGLAAAFVLLVASA
eukprot:CAMPEP_0206177014 /NCGR_PEP_ID=MMETSP1474-20131121/59888_1 /ASSEMBLY_ACC=CAM_ASM_001110 /TAXON_ID=97495 /ORGANISM="Imantonia sp., Strain RCC918" /LENGTH=48 /DNA_ID= /DNA_START= /DNA_END= /DNA_ORIENTATION=